jgi:methionine transaminase
MINSRLQTSFKSKLPQVSTTIFSVMSEMAQEHSAVNLSQGFPDFPMSPALIELVNKHMQTGSNQYAPMPGVVSLREQIAEIAAALYGNTIDPETQITITSGGTEAIFSVVAAILRPGDEAIILEPAYDCYAPAVELCGGKPVYVSLNPADFSVNWQAVQDNITEKTRLIFINTPHNPTGAVLSATDLVTLADIVRDTSIVVISDEVYEHIIFDGLPHQSVLRNEELAARSVAVFSFGKTFHATGWKVGYCIAPAWLTKEIRKVHQYVQFSVHTPTQMALAEYLKNKANYSGLSAFYQQKRNLFLELMAGLPFEAIPSKGTYFQLFSYQNFSQEADRTLAELLTKKAKVASIPVSVFYHDHTDHHFLRFCFAKDENTLRKAAGLLKEWFSKNQKE